MRNCELAFVMVCGAMWLLFGACVQASDTTSPPLIPMPREVVWNQQDRELASPVTIEVAADQSATLADAGAAVRRVLGENKLAFTEHSSTDKSTSQSIRLSIESSAEQPKESFILTITASAITIRGADRDGVFYGIQTLRQLMQRDNDRVKLPLCVIKDSPAFALRGFMHDVGRNFQTVESLKAQLDIFAAYKINTFHFHVTDNPGWRVECKAFPQLNDPKNHSRDKGQFYTYAQVRDLIAYAKARSIRIIPELDMPGHSAYFKPAMGFTMDSDEGMAALEKIIDEFCAEIPASDCPIIHLGSDEVRIKDPKQFIARMTARVRANGRQVMMWNPGLPGDDKTILQLWQEKAAKATYAKPVSPFIDSAAGYLNNIDPFIGVQRYFFHQNALRERGDDMALGGILCCWPDIRVEDKSKIALHNGQWPVTLAYADSLWHGRKADAPDYYTVLPPQDSDAFRSYQEFETRLLAHRDRFFGGLPFPFVKTSHIRWKIAGPFERDKSQAGETAFEPEKQIKSEYAAGQANLKWIPVNGGTVILEGRWKDGVFANAPQNLSTAYALTYLYSESDATLRAWTGFETPFRSNRNYGGIPPEGQWDAFGANIWINDAPLAPPTWREPGKYNATNGSIFSGPKAEQPYTDEEFYWTREPSTFAVHKGWNKILIRSPRGYAGQNWSFSFIPVKRNSGNSAWVEDLSVRFDPDAKPE